MSVAPVVVVAAENPLLPASYDIIWSSVVFVILIILFWRLVIPRYLQVLDERSERIEGGIAQAQKAQEEAARLKAEYEEQLAAAREEAGRTREQARAEGAQILAQLRSEAQAEADRIVESARRQIDAERRQAAEELRRDVGRLAIGLAERIVGESMADDARQQRVVDRFLDDLESGTGEPGSGAAMPTQASLS